jgi:hypothetical protein
MSKRTVLSFLFIFLSAWMLEETSPAVFGAIPPVSYTSPIPFAPGERFIYDVLLNDAKVGKAVMKVEKAILQGKEVYHLISEVKSSGFFSLIVPINDRVESYMDVKDLYSHRIEIRKERRRKAEEKVVTFDQIGHRAVQWKNNEEEIFEIPPRVQDSLSSLYFFRTHPLPEAGETITIDIHESEKNGKLEIRSLYRERVTTPAGTFKTIKVQTALPKESPLSSKGRIFIWFTDDDKRVPVLMETESKRGVVTVLLSSQREGKDRSLAAEAF